MAGALEFMPAKLSKILKVITQSNSTTVRETGCLRRLLVLGDDRTTTNFKLWQRHTSKFKGQNASGAQKILLRGNAVEHVGACRTMAKKLHHRDTVLKKLLLRGSAVELRRGFLSLSLSTKKPAEEDEIKEVSKITVQGSDISVEGMGVGEDDIGAGKLGLRPLLDRLATPPLFSTIRLNPMAGDIQTISQSIMAQIKKKSKNMGRPPPVMYMHPVLKDVLVIEVKGPNNIDKLEKEIIVNRRTAEEVLKGGDIYMSGIQFASPDILEDDKVSVYADLEKRFRRGETKAHVGPKLFLGNGIAQHDVKTIFHGDKEKIHTRIGVRMRKPIYEITRLVAVEAIDPTLAVVEPLPSVVCAKVMDPQPGEVILDMCAGIGTKTTHIATLMQNKGRVVALDTQKHFLKMLEQKALKLDLSCIEPHNHDSTKSAEPFSVSSGGPPYPPATFDRILLDVPCCSLGRRPSLQRKFRSHLELQRKLFQKAVQLLKRNGTLVYSTNTITKTENERQVVWALGKFPSLELQTQVPHIGGPGRPYDGLSEENRKKLQFFDPVCMDSKPSMDNDTSAFFIAVFKKKY